MAGVSSPPIAMAAKTVAAITAIVPATSSIQGWNRIPRGNVASGSHANQ
jgi:hypothetical protein